MARVSVYIYLDPATPVPAVGDAGAMLLTAVQYLAQDDVHLHMSSAGFDIPSGTTRAVTGPYTGHYGHGAVVPQVPKCPPVNVLHSQL